MPTTPARRAEYALCATLAWLAATVSAGALGRPALLLALDPPELCVLPVTLAWLAAGAAALLAVRTRGPVIPVVPPLVALGVTVALGGDVSPARPALLAAFAVAAPALVLVRANRLVGMVLSPALAPADEAPIPEAPAAEVPAVLFRVRLDSRRATGVARMRTSALDADDPAGAATPHRSGEAFERALVLVHLDRLGWVALETGGRPVLLAAASGAG
jgi:hypothetical protein